VSSGSAVGTVAITGATGLLGGRLSTDFLRRGWRVRALSRRPVPAGLCEPSVVSFHCDLPHSIDVRALRGADVLVHCAYATRSSDLRADWRVNVQGTRRLRACAREAGVRKFVFVSSVSARPNALSFYGRSKWELEHELDQRSDLTIRPGLIVARSGGLFRRMVDAMRRTAIIPAFGGGRQIAQTIHVDDLTTAFERAVRQDLSGVLIVAEPRGSTAGRPPPAGGAAAGAPPPHRPLASHSERGLAPHVRASRPFPAGVVREPSRSRQASTRRVPRGPRSPRDKSPDRGRESRGALSL
jgi:nucleoside-diphosphate-sugar epimerase